MHDWVNKWVLGVSSLNNLMDIVDGCENIKNIMVSRELKEFKGISHPLIDPRNWGLK
jgi:hypothetical protein